MKAGIVLVINLLLWFVIVVHSRGRINEDVKNTSKQNISSTFPLQTMLGQFGFNVGQIHWKNGECTDNRACNCLSDCFQNGSCCMDYQWNSTQLYNPSSIQTIMKKHIKGILEKVRPQFCLPFSSAYPAIKEHFIMINTCLPNSIESDLNHCLSPTLKNKSIDTIPVLGSNNFLYKNLHCARCNNITEYGFLKQSIPCHSDFPTAFQVHDLCSVSSVKTNSHLRCDPLRCDNNKAALCGVYGNMFYTAKSTYKNIFCAECIDKA